MTHPNNDNTHAPPRRSRAARVSLFIGAGIAAFMAVGALGLGGLALWGESQKDDRGYISTDSERFGASSHALATENLDIDLDGAQELVDATGFGEIRVDVAPRAGKPVFVGIARTDDVSAYLAGVSHTKVADVDYEPFEASYVRQPGPRSPAAPAGERIWAASTQGTGRQSLKWDAEDGDWSVVVMNADGSRGVQADISAGAKLPFLNDIGWSALGSGTLLLLTAVALLVLGIRPPRSGSRGTSAAGLAPAAG